MNRLILNIRIIILTLINLKNLTPDPAPPSQASNVHANAWNDFIAGPAPHEVKDEWTAISTCGFGNQKKLILCRCFIHFLCFVIPHGARRVVVRFWCLVMFKLGQRKQQLLIAAYSIGGMQQQYMIKRITYRRTLTFAARL